MTDRTEKTGRHADPIEKSVIVEIVLMTAAFVAIVTAVIQAVHGLSLG